MQVTLGDGVGVDVDVERLVAKPAGGESLGAKPAGGESLGAKPAGRAGGNKGSARTPLPVPLPMPLPHGGSKRGNVVRAEAARGKGGRGDAGRGIGIGGRGISDRARSTGATATATATVKRTPAVPAPKSQQIRGGSGRGLGGHGQPCPHGNTCKRKKCWCTHPDQRAVAGPPTQGGRGGRRVDPGAKPAGRAGGNKGSARTPLPVPLPMPLPNGGSKRGNVVRVEAARGKGGRGDAGRGIGGRTARSNGGRERGHGDDGRGDGGRAKGVRGKDVRSKPMATSTRQCAACGEAKALSAYSNSQLYKAGGVSTCIACVKTSDIHKSYALAGTVKLAEGEERRVDHTDGQPKTWNEFSALYGAQCPARWGVAFVYEHR